ncbi:MAG: hypothetical protein ACYTFA_16420 [Planctomycetota bacterium]
MKEITRPSLIAHSALALAIPALAALAFCTEAFESLVVFATGTTATTWLSIILVGAGVLYELKLLSLLALYILAGGSVDRANAILAAPDRVRRARYIKFAAATVLLTFLVSFFVLEVVFRFFAIVPPEGTYPEDAPRFLVDNSVNSRGMREPWETIPDDDPRRRIAFLGDSFVYGYAVEPEETFTSLVEEMLSDTITINMGGIGSNPEDQYFAYSRLKDETRPDVLVHVIFLNDLDFDLGSMLQSIHRIPHHDSWLARQSYVVRYIEKQIQFLRSYRKTLDYFSGGETAARRAASWAKFEKYVTLCKEAAEEGGGEYRLVIFPWLYKLDDYPLRHVHRKVCALARKLGVPLLDLLGSFEGLDGLELRVGKVDPHPNAAGHRIAAAAISEFLESR